MVSLVWVQCQNWIKLKHEKTELFPSRVTFYAMVEKVEAATPFGATGKFLWVAKVHRMTGENEERRGTWNGTMWYH